MSANTTSALSIPAGYELDDRSVRVLRYTLGSTLAMTVAMAFDWNLAFLAPVLTVSVLASNGPELSIMRGMGFVFLLILSCLAAWLMAQGRIKIALIAILVLLLTQPLSPLSSDSSWNTPRLTAPLLAVFDILVAAGFAFLVPHLDWLTSPMLDKNALTKGLCILGLLALAFVQGNALAQDWRLRPADRDFAAARKCGGGSQRRNLATCVNLRRTDTPLRVSGRASGRAPAKRVAR